jgi:transposase
MAEDLLSTREAARRLGVTVTTLYDWLGRSDNGLLVLRGRKVTVTYYQGGPCGQGRIRVAESEVARVLELMRVHPCAARLRRPPRPAGGFPGITVPLGRPS